MEPKPYNYLAGPVDGTVWTTFLKLLAIRVDSLQIAFIRQFFGHSKKLIRREAQFARNLQQALYITSLDRNQKAM